MHIERVYDERKYMMKTRILNWFAVGCLAALLATCAMHPNEEPPPKTGARPQPLGGGSAKRGGRGQAPVPLDPGEDLGALTADLKLKDLPEGKVMYLAYAGGIRGEIEPCG